MITTYSRADSPPASSAARRAGSASSALTLPAIERSPDESSSSSSCCQRCAQIFLSRAASSASFALATASFRKSSIFSTYSAMTLRPAADNPAVTPDPCARSSAVASGKARAKARARSAALRRARAVAWFEPARRISPPAGRVGKGFAGARDVSRPARGGRDRGPLYQNALETVRLFSHLAESFGEGPSTEPEEHGRRSRPEPPGGPHQKSAPAHSLEAGAGPWSAGRSDHNLAPELPACQRRSRAHPIHRCSAAGDASLAAPIPLVYCESRDRAPMSLCAGPCAQR